MKSLLSLPAINCSKLKIEALDQDVKYVQIQQQRRQNDANIVNIFHTLF